MMINVFNLNEHKYNQETKTYTLIDGVLTKPDLHEYNLEDPFWQEHLYEKFRVTND